MTTDTLSTLKSLGKRLARAQRLPHMAALDNIARHLGKPYWRALAEAHKQGWAPSPEQVASVRQFVDDAVQQASGIGSRESALSAFGDSLVFTRWVPENVAPMDAEEIHGELDGQTFYLGGDGFEVAIGSQGWEIILDQSPAAKPELRRLGGRVKSVASLEPAFIERATQLLRIRAQRMHAEVAADWPRRSTKPDQQGQALHPLGNGLAATWYCLHCDGVHDGATMAKTLWHCPDCGATPIDIFPTPFWNPEKQSA
jgi:hypothetical protein